MPIYEYICDQCGKVNDVLQKVNDPPPTKCEACGAERTLHKALSRTSFVLKGGGWYSDLYSSTKKDSGTKDAGKKDTAAKDSGASKPSGSSTTTSTTSTSSASAASSPSSTLKKD